MGRPLHPLLVALALASALAACSTPTASPTPTASLAPSPAAVVPSLPAPTVPATATASARSVEFGELVAYSHPSGVFTLSVPQGWAQQNNDKPDELIQIWTDPTRNGGLIVDVFEDENPYGEEQLGEILGRFLQRSFGSQQAFVADAPVPQPDGSQLVVWSYLARAEGGVPIRLFGRSQIEQQGDKVAILTALVPQDQVEAAAPTLEQIVASFRLDPSKPLVAAP